MASIGGRYGASSTVRAAPLLTLLLAAAAVAASPVRAAPLEPEQLCAASVSAIDRAAAATMAQGSPGMIVAVARDGRPLLQKAYGIADLEQDAPMTMRSVFRMASITKQFTAAAVLALQEEGRLSLDDSLSRHLPESGGLGSVTLRQLLLHTSGIADYAGDEAGSRTKAAARSGAEMLAWILHLSPAPRFAPGTRWEYSNSNYVLLGLAAERASGMPLAELFRRRLFEPAGLRNTGFDEPADIVPGRVRGYRKAQRAAGGFVNADAISYTIPGAAGGLRTTAADLLAWSDALFGGRVLRPASLAQMVAPGRLSDGRTTRLGMPPAWQEGLKADYALGLFVSATPYGPRLWHSGDIDGFSTWLAHYPDRRVTILLMENSESADLDRDGIEAAVFRSLEGRCR